MKALVMLCTVLPVEIVLARNSIASWFSGQLLFSCMIVTSLARSSALSSSVRGMMLGSLGSTVVVVKLWHMMVATSTN